MHVIETELELQIEEGWLIAIFYLILKKYIYMWKKKNIYIYIYILLG